LVLSFSFSAFLSKGEEGRKKREGKAGKEENKTDCTFYRTGIALFTHKKTSKQITCSNDSL
jgi:hypothetical protein